MDLTYTSWQKSPVDYSVRFVHCAFCGHPPASCFKGQGLADLMMEEMKSKFESLVRSIMVAVTGVRKSWEGEEGMDHPYKPISIRGMLNISAWNRGKVQF